jgi:hypothetical protein
MNYTKGDLVLVSKDKGVSTCIVLTSLCQVADSHEYSFYYTYCLESGLYGVVYNNEIISLVSEGFAPDFKFHDEIFETDYSFYDYLFEAFSFYPSYFHSGSFGQD